MAQGLRSGDPLVSVAIPCFNYAHYLNDCLCSVVAQTYANWEAIVVDDKSTEGDVGFELARFPDPRIRLIRHSINRGLATTRNTAIRGSNGELVLPLDADDKLDPLYLETLTGWLTKNPTYDAVFSDFELFEASSERMRFTVRTTEELLTEQWIPGPGTLYRRSLFDAVNGYFDDLRAGNEDWDFWLAAAANGLHVGHVPQPLYHYRRHSGSLSSDQRLTEHATRELIYKRHQRLFDQHGLGRAFRAEGYRRSMLAEASRRNFWRAVTLAMGGLSLSPVSFIHTMLSVLRQRIRGSAISGRPGDRDRAD